MNFEVVHVSRGDIRLKREDRRVRVLGEALIASAPTDPSFVIYLNSLNNWEMPPDIALTDAQKQDVVSAIRKHFQDRGSVVEFE
jgi:hypothetical protein